MNSENKNAFLPILVVVVIALFGFIAFKTLTNNSMTPGAQDTSTMPVEDEDMSESTDSADSDRQNMEFSDGIYKVDTTESSIKWTGKKTILTNWIDTGFVKIKEGQVNVANGDVTTGSIVVDMTSIQAETTGRNAGQEMLAKHLKSPDFFDAEKYPTSTFKLNKATKFDVDASRYTLSGDLTIKDKTQPVTVEVMVTKVSDNKFRLTGNMLIDRTAYDVKYGSSKFFGNLGDNVISDTFELQLDLVGSK